jgi:transposase-like protein
MRHGLAASRPVSEEADSSRGDERPLFWWRWRSRGKGSGRVRMRVIPDFKAKTIIPFLIQNVSLRSTIYTDGLKSFEGLREAGFKHIARAEPLRSELRKGAKSAVPLADRAIGNLQQWLIGTYHGVSRAQLQVYLDEFVFRHNRRKQPGRKSTEYQSIRGAKDLADSS